MLNELENITGGNEDIADRLSKAANVLLHRQFLYSGDRGIAQAYDAITHPKYKRYFENLFEAIGYRLHRRDNENWIGIIPDTEIVAPPRMKLHETLLLLVLCVIWQEAVNNGDVEDRVTVRSDTGEIYDRHVAILGKERIELRQLREILKEFKRKGIVEFGDEDPETQVFEVIIRPIIRLIAGDAPAEKILRHASSEITRMEVDHQIDQEIRQIDEELDQEAEK